MIIKLKPSKPHLNLPVVLWVMLVLIVTAELFVLYQYMFSNLFSRDEILEPGPKVRIDTEALDRVKNWLDEKRQYQLPNYSLRAGRLGRENPFAEY